MTRRFDEQRGKAIIDVLQKNGLAIQDYEIDSIVKGASE
jgi:hypothetical protein